MSLAWIESGDGFFHGGVWRRALQSDGKVPCPPWWEMTIFSIFCSFPMSFFVIYFFCSSFLHLDVDISYLHKSIKPKF